jgi:hypothetical protein
VHELSLRGHRSQCTYKRRQVLDMLEVGGAQLAPRNSIPDCPVVGAAVQN